MNRSLLALTALLALGASWYATAFATPLSKGSIVLAPSLIGMNVSTRPRPMAVVILPPQAGKVSTMLATNVVSKGASWIAKGDKYYSLCIPNYRMMACAPIVASSIMQELDVGAFTGPDGATRITFQLVPGARQTQKRTMYAIDYFMSRLDSQATHFNRRAASYATVRGVVSSRSDRASASGAEGSPVDGCNYTDAGAYDCTGGDAGIYGGAGAYGSAGADGGAERGRRKYSVRAPLPLGKLFRDDCDSNCNFPSGKENGDGDPCIDSDGNTICPVAFSTRTPSLGEPQSMCDLSLLFCSGGLVPTKPPPPMPDEWRRVHAIQQCYDNASAMAVTCRETQWDEETQFAMCLLKASGSPLKCEMNEGGPSSPMPDPAEGRQ